MRRYLPPSAINRPVVAWGYTRAMMIKHILTTCAAAMAALVAGAAGTSLALAQGYPQGQNPAYSTAPAPYQPGYPLEARRGAPGTPDFDALDDDDDVPNAQSSTRLSPPGLGPVMSPDDPRYGRPMGAPPVYTDRGPAPQGPILSPNDPRYGRARRTAAGDLFGPARRPAAADLFGARRRQSYSGLRVSSIPKIAAACVRPRVLAVRPALPERCSLRQGADGRPMVLSALPPEEQPEVGPAQLPPHLRKQEVAFATKEPAGTLIVDTPNTHLYYVLGGGRAIRYGVRVGRDGFTWNGVQKVTRKAEWPDWHPPTEMIERQPYLPRFMAGGPGNPLGARAMYLGNTVFRIHGTNQPSTIGKFVSSGCIGMLNEDVSDLFDRVKVGTRVVVLPGGAPPASTATASAQPVPGPAGAAPAMSNAGTQPTVVPPLPAPVTVR